MRWFAGHLGSSVSALVDGQLDADSTERAWSHVLTCPSCRRLVEREGWVKSRVRSLGGNEPSARLIGSLYHLEEDGRPGQAAARPSWEGVQAWAAVDEIERRGRGRRRAGLAVVGAGSVSAAVLGFAYLGGASLGIGQAPAGNPVTSFTGSTAPGAPPAASVRRTPTIPAAVQPTRNGARQLRHVVNR